MASSSTTTSSSSHHLPAGRRGLLLGLAAAALGFSLPGQAALAASDLVPAVLTPDKAPDQSAYDPADPDLREAAGLLQRALNATTVQEEEALWSEVISRYRGVNAAWGPDVVGRAYGNRGNARSRQGKLAEALADYNAAIRLCPWSADPVINRGVALEALGRWDEAAADYRAAIAAAPDDPVPYNNLGNTYGGMGRWAEAEASFAKAASLAPSYSFAAANRALALFQLGRSEEAIRQMRSLLRRYPDFPDMRAALAAAQWAAGREGDAETNWERVEDPRYKDLAWLRRERRWPPALVDSLAAFLQLKSVWEQPWERPGPPGAVLGRVRALQSLDLPAGAGPHATVLAGNERIAAVSTYYVQHPAGLALGAPFTNVNEKAVRLFSIAPDGNSFKPHPAVPLVNFKALFPHKGVARPHGMAFRAVPQAA